MVADAPLAGLANGSAFAVELTVTSADGTRQVIAVQGRWRVQRPWLISDVIGHHPSGPVTGSVSAKLGTVLLIQAPFISEFTLALEIAGNRLLVDAHGLSPRSWAGGLSVPGRLLSRSDGTPVGDVEVSISMGQALGSLAGVLEAWRSADP